MTIQRWWRFHSETQIQKFTEVNKVYSILLKRGYRNLTKGANSPASVATFLPTKANSLHFHHLWLIAQLIEIGCLPITEDNATKKRVQKPMIYDDYYFLCTVRPLRLVLLPDPAVGEI